MKKKSKKAFTLAEVLITLTIIGVVAALTVPVVVSRQGDAELTARFKKAYSTMSRAVNTTNMIDLAGGAACYYGKDGLSFDNSGCNGFFKTLAQNLNIIKTCKGNALQNGCVPKYTSYTSAAGCDGFYENTINNLSHVYVLADGQIIIGYYNFGYPLFAIDINGMKGPNKPGHDLFSFNIFRSPEKGMYLAAAGCIPISSGGRSTGAMMEHAFAGME